MMMSLDSATLAKLTEPAPTKASPRPSFAGTEGDLRPEKADFTFIGVKFTLCEFQIQ
jgi:hypothetical protein